MEKQDDSLWSLCPVQDIDSVLTNRLLYCDLLFRHYKETLKHTMLGQESVFENQIHELHRLYQRQKDLMMEMDETNNFYTQPQHLFPDAGGRSIHWMGSIISTSKTSVWPPEDASAKIDEAGISGVEIDKSGEKVVDLEYGYHDIWEEEGSKNVEVHEVPNIPKDQSPRSMPLESVVQPESVQHIIGLSRFKCILDLNEPTKIGEHSDYELNQFLTPAQTRSERAEPEVQEPLISTKCQAENGINLNMSPLSSEEVTIIRTIESEQPQGFVSASLHGKHGSEPSHSRAIVLALPSSKTISLFHQRYSRPRPRKKAKRGAKPKSVKKFPRSKSQKRSNLDSNFGVNEDDNHSLSPASYIPDSDHYQERLEKGSLSSLAEVKRRRRCKPHIESCKVMRKISRTKSKTRGSFPVTEEEEQELSVAAAEAIVDMSLSDLAKTSSIKTSDCITPLRWFSEIASSVVEDSKSEVGPSVTEFHSDYQLDYFEAMTLQLTEIKPEEQRTDISVSNIVHPKHKRTLRSRGNRQQHGNFLPILSTFTGNKAPHGLQKMRRLIEGSETNDAHCSLMENMVIDWGTIRKRRRGIRSPAGFTRTSILSLLSGS